MPKIKRPPRHFLPEDFIPTTWEALSPYFMELLAQKVDSVKDLETLLKNRSELEAVLEEDFAWKYIKMNKDTTDQEAQKAFHDFVENIQPKLALEGDKLNKKIVQNEHFEALPDAPYLTYKRNLKSSVEIFRTENVPLFTELEKEAQQFGSIQGAMTIEHEGEELTMQQASLKLQENDRGLREAVYRKTSSRRMQDQKPLDQLCSDLVTKRHKVAQNAGFENFRDYMFVALGRFDYTPQDCFDFHQAVKTHVVPVVKKILQQRASKLKLDTLRPWDMHVDVSGKPALKPFDGADDLIVKTKECFNRLDPFFGEVIQTMDDLGHFDLESRKGKAPGGFMYPLYEIGVPFIYMNSVNAHRDLETIVHEGGHAIHSMLTRDYPLNEWKSTPSEVAELASMSMELISMAHWDVFYSAEELERARQEKFEEVVMALPWIAIVDAFQHWLYENPDHTPKQRKDTWLNILSDFDTGMVDYTDFETDRAIKWQSQMHIYEVPFYYIEYGFAQLGAIAMWKNFETDNVKGLEGYQDFMKLGYTKTIPEIYEAAGIKFDFSPSYIKDLMDFVEGHMQFD